MQLYSALDASPSGSAVKTVEWKEHRLFGERSHYYQAIIHRMSLDEMRQWSNDEYVGLGFRDTYRKDPSDHLFGIFRGDVSRSITSEAKKPHGIVRSREGNYILIPIKSTGFLITIAGWGVVSWPPNDSNWSPVV